MNDSTPETPLQQARNGLYDAATQLEKVLFNLGYDSGFNAGWDAASRRFAAMMQDTPPPEEKPPAHVSAGPPTPAKLSDPDDHSAKDTVLAYIKLHPGQRGSEVAQGLEKALPNERTVRTALHRLKTSGQIRNDDGRWYANEE